MSDWHGTHITRPHAHVGHKFSGVLITDFPINLAIELNEPLDSVVTMFDGQAMLLSCGTKETMF